MVPQSHRESLKPIIAKGFVQRGQVCDKNAEHNVYYFVVPYYLYYTYNVNILLHHAAQIDLIDVGQRPDGDY